MPALSSVLNNAGLAKRAVSPLVPLLGNDEIESQLKKDRMNAKNEIKMLLLGAGESGKVRFLRYRLALSFPPCTFDRVPSRPR